MKEVFVLDYLRLPTGKQNGIYNTCTPETFTSHLLNGLVNKHPELPSLVDRIYLSTAVGTGGNMARYIALQANFPVNIPSITIDAQCVGAYEAINSGNAQIMSGLADIVIVGGFESTSLKPERKFNSKDPRREASPFVYADFAPATFGENSLIKTAEQIAKEYQISKSEMVDWSILSNSRAALASNRNAIKAVILPFQEHGEDQTFKKVSLLKRFSNRTELIDAATSCLFNDGSGVIILASKRGCEKMEISPKFRLSATATVGVAPGKAPVAFLDAIPTILSQAQIKMNEVDLFEINESFALKPILFRKLHKISKEKINIIGGNLAYGHPFGASGVINLMHLLVSLQTKRKDTGLVAASAAGGLGSSILVQRVS